MTGIRTQGLAITIFVYRNKKGLTKAQLGRLIGYSRSAILLIEKGDRGIAPFMIPVFASILEIPETIINSLK